MSHLIIKRIDFDPEFEPTFLSPVIEHEVLTGLEKAKGIVEKARKEGARLRKKAKEVLEDAKKEYEMEKKKGLEEGRQEGLAQLTEKILEVKREREKTIAEAEHSIIQMVMEIAEKVIGRELKKGAIVDVVKKAMGESVGEKIVVKIHPEDLADIQNHESDLMSHLSHSQTMTVRQDETVPAGGCIVETEMGTVDARLETQMAAIKKALGL